jgi:hypothetical protein
MPPDDDGTPQFQFDAPPPFSFEEFQARILPHFLDTLDGAGGEYLKSLQGKEREFLTRFMYVMIVVKQQNPNMSESEMLYAVNYGLVRHWLGEGHSAEMVREELAKVPWDTLPGMDIYNRETINAVSMRAFADAVAGRPQSPLH